MFQKIVESVEGIADEKEKVNFVSNNATRKEIIMCVHMAIMWNVHFLSQFLSWFWSVSMLLF